MYGKKHLCNVVLKIFRGQFNTFMRYYIAIPFAGYPELRVEHF